MTSYCTTIQAGFLSSTGGKDGKTLFDVTYRFLESDLNLRMNDSAVVILAVFDSAELQANPKMKKRGVHVVWRRISAVKLLYLYLLAEHVQIGVYLLKRLFEKQQVLLLVICLHSSNLDTVILKPECVSPSLSLFEANGIWWELAPDCTLPIFPLHVAIPATLLNRCSLNYLGH